MSDSRWRRSFNICRTGLLKTTEVECRKFIGASQHFADFVSILALDSLFVNRCYREEPETGGQAVNLMTGYTGITQSVGIFIRS